MPRLLRMQRTPLLVSVILVFLLSTSLPQLAFGAADDTVDLQILSINDFHGNISQTATINNRPAGGAAYLATYLYERESEQPNTIKVQCGDAIGASLPVSSLFNDEPTLQILGFMGFEIGTPGNHSFDRGTAELMRVLRGGLSETTGYFAGCGFPYVAANIVDATTKNPIFPPYVIKEVEGVPVAFIGVVTLETPTIVMASGIIGLEFTDPVEAINRYVAELRAKGVEAIMVLAHEGGTQDTQTGEITGPIRQIAEGVDDAVDVIFSGHSHTKLNGTVDGKLIVQAYSKGTAFADVDLIIDKASGDVISKHGEIVDVYADAKPADKRIAKLVAYYEDAVRPVIERPVGTAASAITRDQSKAGESALGNLIADSQRWAAGTEMAFMNPGGIRADLPKGPVAWGKLFEIQPFGNSLVRVRLTGDQIYTLLNQQWQPYGDGYRTRFLQISGLRYTWSESRPMGDKVVDVFLADGTPVDRSRSYTAVINSFLAGGGDNFTVLKDAAYPEYLMTDLDAFVAYVKSLPQPMSAQIEGRVTVVE